VIYVISLCNAFTSIENTKRKTCPISGDIQPL
jgi:hypothetical protein